MQVHLVFFLPYAGKRDEKYTALDMAEGQGSGGVRGEAFFRIIQTDAETVRAVCQCRQEVRAIMDGEHIITVRGPLIAEGAWKVDLYSRLVRMDFLAAVRHPGRVTVNQDLTTYPVWDADIQSDWFFRF